MDGLEKASILNKINYNKQYDIDSTDLYKRLKLVCLDTEFYADQKFNEDKTNKNEFRRNLDILKEVTDTRYNLVMNLIKEENIPFDD